MPFIDPAERPVGVLIGPAEGARVLFRARERHAAGFFVGLHRHEGDETFEVRAGAVRFTVGREQRACGPGMLAVAPAGVRHGFVVLEDCVLDVVSQQDMGLVVVERLADGSEREVEVFMEGFPSSHRPPPGEPWTPGARIRELYASTRGSLGDGPPMVGSDVAG
jgi:hypothetical protein